MENKTESTETTEIKDEIEVDCVSLDSYVEENKIEIIDFIWADVQGAEDYLILGGKKSFSEKVRYFYTEYSSKDKYYENSPDKDQIKNLLGEDWIILQDFGSDILLKNTRLDDKN